MNTGTVMMGPTTSYPASVDPPYPPVTQEWLRDAVIMTSSDSHDDATRSQSVLKRVKKVSDSTAQASGQY